VRREGRARQLLLLQGCGREPVTPTTCASRKSGDLAKRSATNSRYRCAGRTIGNCTAQARRQPGGAGSGSNRSE